MLNCAISGKLIENPINRVHEKIVTTKKQYLKGSFRLTLKRAKQLRNGAIAIEIEKCRINLKKQI